MSLCHIIFGQVSHSHRAVLRLDRLSYLRRANENIKLISGFFFVPCKSVRIEAQPEVQLCTLRPV